MAEVIPAILEEDFSEIERKAGSIAGFAGAVQIDICDGRFVPRKSWPFVGDRGEFRRLAAEENGLPHWEKLDYEFDLMVEKPEAIVGDFVRVGAARIVVHAASTAQFGEILRKWGEAVEMGCAVPSDARVENIAHFLDTRSSVQEQRAPVAFIQVMGIANIGFQGQPFDERALTTLSAFRAAYPEFLLSVDGGVSRATAPRLVAAGAERLVAGSAIFKAPNVKEAIAHFRSLG